MKKNNPYGFATTQIHAGSGPEQNGAMCAPIYQTSTFRFGTVEQGGARFAGEEPGYIYSRLGNPTQRLVEEKMAALEGAEDALVTASGMGAISTALWSALGAGDEIVADETLYGCTYALLNHGISGFGVKVIFADLSEPARLREHLTEKTKVVYFETPCNPTLKLLDIAGISRVAHEYNPAIKVMVDNTFCSPYLQQPLALGANVVLHSATKYLNGHGDVIAGVVAGESAFIRRCQMFGLKDMTGAVVSPFDAFLLARGLKTLDIRMERHCRNAAAVADFLAGHPAVKTVYYPGLKDFPRRELAQRQMKLPGGMISFELYADREGTAAVLNKLSLIAIAVSLGDAETLIEHPASMTHSAYSAEDLAAAGIPQGLVRLSVGLEDPEDIIADLKAVLDLLVTVREAVMNAVPVYGK